MTTTPIIIYYISSAQGLANATVIAQPEGCYNYDKHPTSLYYGTTNVDTTSTTYTYIHPHNKNIFVGLTMMFVIIMWGSLCQGLAFIHHKHLLSYSLKY